MKARRGFALLTALGLIVMITVFAVGRTAILKPRRLAVAGVVDHAVLGALATGGVERAREQLIEQLPLGRMQLRRDVTNSFDRWSAADGTVLTGSVGELRYRVELHDAGARLDINAATEDQVRKLLLALRVDAPIGWRRRSPTGETPTSCGARMAPSDRSICARAGWCCLTMGLSPTRR